MIPGKGKPQPTPAEPPVDPILLAAADLRDAAAELRDKAAELDQQLAAVQLERAAHAEVVAERDQLVADNRRHQQALMVALVRLSRTGEPQHAASPTNGSTNVH